MKKVASILPYIFILSVFILPSCDSNSLNPINAVEEITTLSIFFTESSTSEVVSYTFKDLDGIGGNPPEITNTGSLKANTDYQTTILLFNENEPVISSKYDITEEIKSEAEFYQFFYEYDNLFSNFTYFETDVNGNPVGFNTLWTTGNINLGTLRIILRHNPDKFAEGVANGDITNAGGQTNIEVSFDVIIQ